MGWTQGKLADKSNLTEKQISLIETNKAEIKLNTLINLSNALKINVSELCKNIGAYENNSIEERLKNIEIDQQLVKDFIVKVLKDY